VIGKWTSPKDVLEEVQRDKSFYQHSEGGVTLSGGEPTFQLRFVGDLLTACREAGIHVALDTSGFVVWSVLERIVDEVDLFLYDIKHMDDQEHIRLTGVSNHLILQNLERLQERGKEIIVRIPVIPGHDTSSRNLRETRDYLSSLCIKRAELLPYNKAAGAKYRLVGQDYALERLEPCSREEMEEIAAEFRNAGIDTRVRK
jgi:pyruvate formate lyase activating enzyme